MSHSDGKSSDELFDFSDVDEEMTQTLEAEEYELNYNSCMDSFLKEKHDDMIKWFSKKHKDVNPYQILLEVSIIGLLYSEWSHVDIMSQVLDNIELNKE